MLKSSARCPRNAATAAVLAFLMNACGAPAPVEAPVATPTASPEPAPVGPPNLVVILADDLGYGDIGPYGNAAIRTPTLDRIAKEGIKLTSFYVPSPVCAPSRAELMTGRFPSRNGIYWNPPKQLNDGELTIADVLRARGYATGMVGKWHLGWEAVDFPAHHGFDFYYGIPGGEDSGTAFFKNDLPTDDRVGPDLLTRHYTDTAIAWMKTVPKDKPFFLYLAHHSPHLPNYVTAPFAGQSAAGAYGDVIEEMDFTIGQVLQALKDMGVDRNTLVFFTSDNGPALPPGSAGPFTGGKGSDQEGGVRMPGLARWPARIPAGRVSAEPMSTLDLFPTFVALAGGNLPPGRVYDGADVTSVLTGAAEKMPGAGLDGHRELVFWYSHTPVAIRSGKWKYTRPAPWTSAPQLFDLDADPAEINNVIKDHRDVATLLDAHIDQLVSR